MHRTGVVENFRTYSFWRNNLSWQLALNAIEVKRNLDFSPYTLNTIKHLFSIASGNLPGFSPATNEELAPIKVIQDAYLNHYELGYWPTIMEPTHLTLNIDQPTYYSLTYPSLPVCNHYTFKGNSLIRLLDDLTTAMNNYVDTFLNKPTLIGCNVPSLARLIAKTDFTCYNSLTSRFRSYIKLKEDDTRFIDNETNLDCLPRGRNFFDACIAIKNKTELKNACY